MGLICEANGTCDERVSELGASTHAEIKRKGVRDRLAIQFEANLPFIKNTHTEIIHNLTYPICSTSQHAQENSLRKHETGIIDDCQKCFLKNVPGFDDSNWPIDQLSFV